MLTPHGMFELKYFFGSHVATEAGGEASSTAIRALIKQLIGAEDPKIPFSDSKIADMLAEQGMVVARRTVAKIPRSPEDPTGQSAQVVVDIVLCSFVVVIRCCVRRSHLTRRA